MYAFDSYSHMCAYDQRPVCTHQYSKRRYTAIFTLIDTPTQSHSYAHTQRQVCTCSCSHFHTFRLTVTHACIYTDMPTQEYVPLLTYAHIHTHRGPHTLHGDDLSRPLGPSHSWPRALTHVHACVSVHLPLGPKSPGLCLPLSSPRPHLTSLLFPPVTPVRVIVPDRVCLPALVTRACSQAPACQHARMSA